jgi:molecular chaperone GrpE (heat shock protein)
MLEAIDALQAAIHGLAATVARGSLPTLIAPLDMLRALLHDHGVVETAEVGTRWRIDLHETIREERVSTPALDGVVLHVWSQGYRHGGSILRRARVTVGRHASA